VEICGLTVVGPHAVNRRGEIAFYDLRISGRDLWEARQAAVAAIAAAEIKPVAAAELPTLGKFADSTPTGGEARTAPADAAFAGHASAEKFSQSPPRDGNNNTVNDTSEELRPASDPQIDAAASAPPEKEPSKPVRGSREAVSAGDPNIENSLPGPPRGREPGSGTRGRNPGDGTKDDDAPVARMVNLIAENRANNPTAAGKLVAAENKEPVKYAYRRLASKFIKKYGHLRKGREPWGDVCSRIAVKMPAK
jgi:hypothetical protein